MNMSILRRTAAEIAAAALVEVYPNIELLGGGESPTGFVYKFSTSHPIQTHLIEEKMRQIVREKRPIRTLEMVGFSASELLKSQGQLSRAEAVEEGLAKVIQIGSFHDLSQGPHLKNTGELAAFKIEVADNQILGWCGHSKEELKSFLKRLAEYIEPAQLGEQMGFWKGGVWLPQGLEMRRKLIRFLRKEWFTDAFEISGVGGEDLHRSMGKPKVAEVSYLTPWETEIRVSFFGLCEGEEISCLQSIGKTLTILGFDHSAVSAGRESTYVVEDGLGRSHPVVQVKKISKGGVVLTVVVEKMMALLVEKNRMMGALENQ